MTTNLLIHPTRTKEKRALAVPFFRPHIEESEIEAVVETLRSGWLTTGPHVRTFEENFAKAVNGKYAIALNSCTAALHLAVEALGLQEGQAVLVPTMTFAATAEILLYLKAVPILVDCDPVTGNMDLEDARRQVVAIRAGKHARVKTRDIEIVGIIPVHVGGYMIDIDELAAFAEEFGLWVVEDAAHAFPAAWRRNRSARWRKCGENTSAVTCYSFYANKTITTGEGGMAVTNDKRLADRIRLMSLHGLSHDAWDRYSGGNSWDYRIVSPGHKYNMTDIAAAIGIHQLERAENMRLQREKIARWFLDEFDDVAEIEMPAWDQNRVHSWHLFPIRLDLEKLSIDRNRFMEELKAAGVGCSVHWRPLHMHPFYIERFGWEESDLPFAARLWNQLISLPIFSAMSTAEIRHVTTTVKRLCTRFAVKRVSIAA